MGCEKKEGKEKKSEKKGNERERGRLRNGAEIYGVLRRPWLLLSPFHTLVFKILAQWSFFDELAPVVAIIRSIMVLRVFFFKIQRAQYRRCTSPDSDFDKNRRGGWNRPKTRPRGLISASRWSNFLKNPSKSRVF